MNNISILGDVHNQQNQVLSQQEILTTVPETGKGLLRIVEEVKAGPAGRGQPQVLTHHSEKKSSSHLLVCTVACPGRLGGTCWVTVSKGICATAVSKNVHVNCRTP